MSDAGGPKFPSAGDLQQALDLFRAEFAQQLPQRLAQAREALHASRQAPAADEPLRELHGVLHRLAGSAGTFGMPELGAACRALELQLDELMMQPGRTGTDLDAVERALAALAGAAG
jgi:HPt (histidine-containing phosphotransfer) domain-containing protein